MPYHPDEGAAALLDHVREKAALARAKYSQTIDAVTMLHLLEDREVVRYPVAIRFEAWHLEPHEFAYLEQLGEHPSEGFLLFMHPVLEAQRELWPAVIAYYLPSINYGEIVSHQEAELYGATLLGLDVETYYAALCQLSDSLAAHSAAHHPGDAALSGTHA